MIGLARDTSELTLWLSACVMVAVCFRLRVNCNQPSWYKVTVGLLVNTLHPCPENS